MGKILNLIFLTSTAAAVVLLGIAQALFMKYNRPIILHPGALIVPAVLFLALMAGVTAAGWRAGPDTLKEARPAAALLLLAGTAAVVWLFLQGAVLDFFQPYALYDRVIFISLAGILLILFRSLGEAVRILAVRKQMPHSISLLLLLLAFMMVFTLWGRLQKDAEWQNIAGEPVSVFPGGEGGYRIFRIPSLLVVPQGSRLADGQVLEDDLVIAMTEARRNGSPDFGDIDLVQKRSLDGGVTWGSLDVIRQWEDGLGKIGNSVPLFDSGTGVIHLFHIAGDSPSSYVLYNMTSPDGGATWSLPSEVDAEGAISGPGHGIRIEGGPYDGRLVMPAYRNRSSLALYSDDNGRTWQAGAPAGDGNECEIAQRNDEGGLIMTIRTDDYSVARPHPPLQKLFVLSDDGGATWSELREAEEIKEPLCMSSVIRGGDGFLYYSAPDDYYSRSRMSIVRSTDGGRTWQDRRLIYPGPSGYSELGALSDGSLLLLFESGSVEYDERISLVRHIP